MSIEITESKLLLTESEEDMLTELEKEVNSLLADPLLATYISKDIIKRHIKSIRHYQEYYQRPIEEIRKNSKNWKYENCRNTLFDIIEGLKRHKKNLEVSKQYLINCKKIPFLEKFISNNNTKIIDLKKENDCLLNKIVKNVQYIKLVEKDTINRRDMIQELKGDLPIGIEEIWKPKSQ